MIIRVSLIMLTLCLVVIGFGESNLHEGEEYNIKEIFIPWGEVESHLGFIPSITEINENGDTGMVHPGYGVRSWDIGLDGKIYVADEVKRRIAVYDAYGHYIQSIHDFEYPADVAVDGDGNVYVIPSITATSVLKFSPDNKSKSVISHFGEFTSADIASVGFSLYSNSHGTVYIRFFPKEGERMGEFLSVDINSGSGGDGTLKTKKRIYSKDIKGNSYEVLAEEGKWNMPRKYLSFAIHNSTGVIIDTITIYYPHPIAEAPYFRAVDGEGDFYFGGGMAYRKYDQEGNLLMRIEAPLDTMRTFNHTMPGMAAFDKIMTNGDIYYAYMSDQGFVVVKYELQQKSKGQILKPAYIPEDMKK